MHTPINGSINHKAIIYLKSNYSIVLILFAIEIPFINAVDKYEWVFICFDLIDLIDYIIKILNSLLLVI